ncbi:Ultraviolet-B receptor uvr8, variant 2 [Bonamia ostreae]|uniref:Ultraviolet-B receptor uvr8, variant 2 n=1 Tax=Bonamia ostreae TaxID=126728 RepID=A0ABV2AL66_9EUKA
MMVNGYQKETVSDMRINHLTKNQKTKLTKYNFKVLEKSEQFYTFQTKLISINRNENSSDINVFTLHFDENENPKIQQNAVFETTEKVLFVDSRQNLVFVVSTNDTPKATSVVKIFEITVDPKPSDLKRRLSDQKTILEFQRRLIKAPTAIASGLNHSLFLVDGIVFSWGTGLFGSLGHGNLDDIEAPRKIRRLNGLFANKISCGQNHSIVVTVNGAVYAFGSNANGQLGIEESEVNIADFPQLVNFLEDFNVENVFSGNRHSIAVSKDGTIFGWGWNFFGQQFSI